MTLGVAVVAAFNLCPMPAAARSPVVGLTQDEAPAAGDTPQKERESLRFALDAQLEALVPFDGYAGQLAGGGVAAHFWLEGPAAVFQGGFGYRTDFSDGFDKYHQVSHELAGYWLPTSGDITPVFGGGLSVHVALEEYVIGSDATFGDGVFRTTTEDEVKVLGIGGAAALKAGVLFFRHDNARMLCTLSYVFGVDTFDSGVGEHALRVGVGVILGN